MDPALGTRTHQDRGGLRISLQVRVLLLVALVNGVLFGAGLVVLTQRLTGDRRELTLALSGQLAYTVGPTISSSGDLNVGQLLRWPSWGLFEDVVLLGSPWDLSTEGDVIPRGAYLNPVGRGGRSATFDEQGVLLAIKRARDTREHVSAVRGVALPIVDTNDEVWGGCWFVLPEKSDARENLFRLLPWFLGSTLLLTLGTFAVLRRFVLDPVRQLAEGSQRVSRGDFSVRLPVPGRRDELADLIRGFNEMTATVHQYNERLAQQVEAASEDVRRAEAAAMTQRRLAATGELAAGVAHEINNPLGGLLNAVETLAGDELSPVKRTQYIELLRAGLERIRSTVGQLLRFTPRATRTGPVPLVEPVSDALALVRHRARDQHVTLRLCTDGLAADVTAAEDKASEEEVRRRLAKLPPAVGEANEIGQAVLNLLVNSLDALASADQRSGDTRSGYTRSGYTRSGSTISVTVDRAGERTLRLEVADDGPGVEAEELGRVADLFYTTKEVGQGSGLGLAIVHNMVSSHGGRIELDSAPGAGFRVTIELPMWDDSAEETA